jgi:thiamine-phosphate pyrophosphorylase
MSDDYLQSAYRILDASANRAGEGLRTLEESARFALDDPSMTAELKSLRHDLAAALRRLPRERLLSARDTEGDVGVDIEAPREYVRGDASDVVAAAATRTQQSLRVLEEYGKTIDATLARSIEQLRYRCYTLSARLELRIAPSARRLRLQTSKLYVLIDCGPSEQAYAGLVGQLVQGLVDMLQLRDRSATDRVLLARARVGAELARQHGKLFIMNDRADLAVAADTDGVHVGQDELPAADARAIVGPQRLVGVSTHDIAQARQAVADGADYIGCGPIFPGRTKQFDAYVGPPFLTQIAAEITIPAFAIGGIQDANLDQVIRAGVDRIAVTGAVRDAADPVAAAAMLRARLQ